MIGEVDCGICLIKVEDSELLCPWCQQVVHKDCLKEWLRRTPICPSCRRPLRDISEAIPINRILNKLNLEKMKQNCEEIKQNYEEVKQNYEKEKQNFEKEKQNFEKAKRDFENIKQNYEKEKKEKQRSSQRVNVLHHRFVAANNRINTIGYISERKEIENLLRKILCEDFKLTEFSGDELNIVFEIVFKPIFASRNAQIKKDFDKKERFLKSIEFNKEESREAFFDAVFDLAEVAEKEIGNTRTQCRVVVDVVYETLYSQNGGKIVNAECIIEALFQKQIRDASSSSSSSSSTKLV